MWGFDPPVQLLHVDDAAAAVEHAADRDLAGVYNVGAGDLVRWRRPSAWPVGRTSSSRRAAGTFTRLLQWSYGVTADADLVDELKFGRTVATDAFARSGFRPTMTTAQLASARSGSRH